MTTSTKIVHRALASLRLPRKVADLIAYATRVASEMTNNPAFAAPSPPLAAILAAVAELQTAQTAAWRGPGARPPCATRSAPPS